MLLFLLIFTLQSLTQRILTYKASLPIAPLIDIESAEPFPTVIESKQHPGEGVPPEGGTRLSSQGTTQCEKTQLSMMKYHSEEGIWNNKKPIISSELLKGSEKNQKLWIVIISSSLYHTTSEQTC